MKLKPIFPLVSSLVGLCFHTTSTLTIIVLKITGKGKPQAQSIIRVGFFFYAAGNFFSLKLVL